MELKNQVVSLEIAKKLKELGVKQESLFWWHPIPEVLPNSGGKTICCGYDLSYSDTGRSYGSEAKISAFTVAEIGEMLKIEVMQGSVDNFPRPTIGGKWRYDYGDQEMIIEDTEVNCRGKMLIYLLENNLSTNNNSNKGI